MSVAIAVAAPFMRGYAAATLANRSINVGVLHCSRIAQELEQGGPVRQGRPAKHQPLCFHVHPEIPVHALNMRHRELASKPGARPASTRSTYPPPGCAGRGLIGAPGTSFLALSCPSLWVERAIRATGSCGPFLMHLELQAHRLCVIEAVPRGQYAQREAMLHNVCQGGAK